MKVMRYIFTLTTLAWFQSSPVSARTLDDSPYHCDGYARTAYIKTHTQHASSNKAIAVGGYAGCDVSVNTFSGISLGIYTSINSHLTDKNNLHSDFFDAHNKNSAVLGKAAIHFRYNNLDITLGRQVFDSPHMDSDDLRMVPNLFEAYQVNYDVNDNTAVGLAYITRMAGWENGLDQSRFVNIGQVLAGSNEQSIVAWSRYATDDLTVELWNYNIENIENISYIEVAFSGDLSEDIGYEIALQYDRGRETGRAILGNIDADTWGVSTTLAHQNFTALLAYNKNNGHSGAIASLGGGPFFTSMEDQTLDAISGSNARAWVIAAEYQIQEYLTTGIAHGAFQAKNTSDYDVNEMDIYVSYQWHNKLSLIAVYAHINDQNSNIDTDQARIILDYHF